jgi:hypothetical protein
MWKLAGSAISCAWEADYEPFRQERLRAARACSHSPTGKLNMSSFVGLDGRLYKRARPKGVWIGLTIVALTIIGTVMIGLKNMAGALGYIGL